MKKINLLFTLLSISIFITYGMSIFGGDKLITNPKLLKLEVNKWHKLHTVKKGDKVFFKRQEHGGSCFDSKRGLLILIGSNTHSGSRGRGKLEDSNNPRYYNPVTNLWTQDYSGDPMSTYKVNAKHIPVAGVKGDHPWAMHTFGGVIFDSKRDEMVVASHPGHLVPNRFTNQFKELWPKIKKHPTWTYNLEKKTWISLPSNPISFFPNCMVFDSDRNMIIGHNGRGIYELSGEPRSWKIIVKGGQVGWHNNGIYDNKNKVFLGFGTNKNSNDILVYDPTKKTLIKKSTPGTRPPKDQHNPMAFDSNIGKTVVLVDRDKKTTETWLYAYEKDEWQKVEAAGFPVALGMNYNMEYDTIHKVLLLVEGGIRRRPTSTWALKLK
ncbi:MAG: hypothetical protein COA79_02430 [Planctomycetota bacterium]|nr:MAG: hypothetical protein COA79_02430 [Planctomycetota bacterium]